MLETEVINVNWSAKSFTYRTLGNQLKSLPYDYLVLAMGLRPRKLPSSLPGSQLRNIFYVRSLEDASRLASTSATIIKMLETNVCLRRSSECCRNEKYRDHR
jgi:NADPH-dependent 2,4-dienoyl-CoA reductase/sulfur reductase-like enzyme